MLRIISIFLLLISSNSLFPQSDYSVYEMYNVSNYKSNKNFQIEIDFDNIDYILLNAAVFFRTNEVRMQNHLSELTFLKNLECSATMHANEMFKHSFFSHINNLEVTKKNPSDRGKLCGILNPFFAENIATSFGIKYTANSKVYLIDGDKGLFSYKINGETIRNHSYLSLAFALVNQWMNSPGHRDNILNSNALQLGCGSLFYRDKGFNNMGMFMFVQNFQLYQIAKTK